jgi:2-polyprenyl-6-methoxyphenol hydroxylase-like FAD-dependent oxidoreductase
VTAWPPASTQVLVAGGGPVGLATAVELGRRGIRCVVVEPRETVSRARPRCKTVNVRTMEHLRRWGLADRLRERAPLPVGWSQDIVFCTTLAGRELSRFHGVLGLADGGERYPEQGQQAPQFVLEELLRETVDALRPCVLATGWSVESLDRKPAEVQVSLVDAAGTRTVVTADYVVGADGPRSVVRDLIGAHYVGEHALRPNFGMVFRAPGLWEHVAHGPAVQYWTVNPEAPGIVGPLDRSETWWCIAFGVDRETGTGEAHSLVRALTGVDTEVEVLSTDPWTARMQLVDRVREGRVFLAGDAAHLNPPFGGHGLNTGVGDAVDLGWKLAAVLDGWGGPALLDSYEAERRPVQDRVIAEATANMTVLSTELVGETSTPTARRVAPPEPRCTNGSSRRSTPSSTRSVWSWTSGTRTPPSSRTTGAADRRGPGTGCPIAGSPTAPPSTTGSARISASYSLPGRVRTPRSRTPRLDEGSP